MRKLAIRKLIPLPHYEATKIWYSKRAIVRSTFLINTFTLYKIIIIYMSCFITIHTLIGN